MPKLRDSVSGTTIVITGASSGFGNREVHKAPAAPPTAGAVYKPMADTTKVDGGIRRRMQQEDEAKY